MSQVAVATGSYKLPDLSYTPGDFTAPEYRVDAQDLQYGMEKELPLNRIYLTEQEKAPRLGGQVDSATGRQFPALAAAQARYTGQLNGDHHSEFEFSPGKDLISLPPVVSNQQQSYSAFADQADLRPRKMPLHSITEKPNERCPSPVVPAYANFELAKRMHQDNLDHQPLPDCVADLAFRRAQISGGHGGLALEIDPIATGVGVKTHNAGPTHCTKMKVFRPKTGGGVLPKAFTGDTYRGIGSAPAKKMGAMDLAIGWDFKPANPADEPRLARHIDGSNDSAGPAVFTCVKTPREDQQAGSTELGRSAGVFTSTLGEPDFFDKDILRRKTDFAGRGIERETDCACDYSPPARARSVSRDSSASHCRRAPTLGMDAARGAGGGGLSGLGVGNRLAKQYQSTPMLGDKAYQALREKYLGPDTDCGTLGASHDHLHHHHASSGPACKRDQLMRRPPRRLCHKVAPAPKCCPSAHGHGHCLTSKAAFRAGMPKLNASGDFVGVGCGGAGGGGGVGGCGSPGASRVLVVPRPRQPYAKKNYDIDTLVPPFRSQAGGAGQGGYPEHWRLSSVYQHAYKPIDQRRRPLLQTVYK